MSLFQKAMTMFGRQPPKPLIDEAIERNRAVSAKADQLNDLLQPYLQKDDPFKAFAVDVFERVQESRIYHGDEK